MENKLCRICDKGKLKRKIIPYSVYGTELGRFPAYVCNNCGEEWFDEQTSLEIERIEKEKGFFGLSKKSKITYSGNSLIIRIPRPISKFMKLKKEEPITIYPEGPKKLTIEME